MNGRSTREVLAVDGTLLDVQAEWQVDSPTVLIDVPDDVYHGGQVRTPGPQTSQSALKQLLPPSTPRDFQHVLLNGLAPSRSLDRGRAAHTLVLGRGDEFVMPGTADDFDLWCAAHDVTREEALYVPEAGDKTKRAPSIYATDGSTTRTALGKAWNADMRASGRTPLNRDDWDAVHFMADAVLAHPGAAELMTDPNGVPEVSAFAELTDPDAQTALWLRGRFDLMRESIVDFKTTTDPRPDAWRTSAWKYGYHVQDACYRWLWEAVYGDDPGALTFVVVGSAAPYLVGLYSLDDDFQELGRTDFREAVATYLDQYAKHGDPRQPGVMWDGLPDGLTRLAPPRRALYSLTDREGIDTTSSDDADELVAFLEGILE